MIGERVFPPKYGRMRVPEGGYGRDRRGRWWVRPPGEDAIPLPTESVVEHPDGTITVYEGINGHGLVIDRGVWRTDEGRQL